MGRFALRAAAPICIDRNKERGGGRGGGERVREGGRFACDAAALSHGNTDLLVGEKSIEMLAHAPVGWII